jgi:hypothetical protein
MAPSSARSPAAVPVPYINIHEYMLAAQLENKFNLHELQNNPCLSDQAPLADK